MKKAFIISIFLISSSISFASETLCHTCEISWIDTEKSNGDIVLRSADNIGSGPCVGTALTTRSTVTDRQKDQLFSAMLAAMMAGKKITAHGETSGCGSLTHITIKSD